MASLRFLVQFLLTRGATENKDLYEHGRKTSRRATQLYFPGEPRNASDGIFNADLLIAQASVGGVNEGTFNFVVQL